MDKNFKAGDMVSFVHAGKKMNGIVEYVLEGNDGFYDFFCDGDCVVKPHPRYMIDGYIILPSSHLERLLNDD